MSATRLSALILGIGLLAGVSAQAAPALVVYEQVNDPNPVYSRTVENLKTLAAVDNLGPSYDHLDVLSGDSATFDNLIQQIRLRGERRDVDVLVLAPAGEVSAAAIRAQGALPRLRLVYLAGDVSAASRAAWVAAGARLVVAHPEQNAGSAAFFTRFLNRWGQGWAAQDAIRDATSAAEQAEQSLGAFLKNGAAPFPVQAQGMNLDRHGELHDPVALASAVVPAPVVRRQAFAHSDFETLSIQLLSAMLPLTQLNSAYVASPQLFVEHASDLSWGQMKEIFPSPLPDGALSGPDAGVPAMDDTWIDGESLRFLIGSVLPWAGDKGELAMSHLQGVWLARDGGDLHLSIYFDQGFRINVQDEDAASNWQLYAIDVPKTIRFRVHMQDGVVYFSGLSEGVESLNPLIKMPVLPDAIYIRSGTFNLADGTFHVEVGAVDNLISLAANGRLVANKLQNVKVDVWESIRENLSFLGWPSLIFSQN